MHDLVKPILLLATAPVWFPVLREILREIVRVATADPPAAEEAPGRAAGASGTPGSGRRTNLRWETGRRTPPPATGTPRGRGLRGPGEHPAPRPEGVRAFGRGPWRGGFGRRGA